MKILRWAAVTLLLLSTLGAPPTAAHSAEAYTDQTNVSFTSSSTGLTSKYHIYAAGLKAPAGLLLQFHGDGAYEFKNPNSSYALGGNNGIIAQARARNLITVPVLAPDTSGSITWWEAGANNAKYVRDLVAELQSKYDVRSDRIWLVGYSGGAQFITQYFLPAHSSIVAGGGGAVIFGGGGKPRSSASFSASVKANFSMHWYTGANDTKDSSGWDALADAKAGEAWYASSGFTVSHEWPAGVSHDLSGKFGAVVAQQLDAKPGSSLPSPTPTPSATPKPTATPTPSATPKPTATPTPSATPKPTATPTPSATPKPTATPTPTPSATPSPTPTSTWVTAVKPSQTGVTVSVAIPSSASGRTTLTVYSSGGSYWYTYTTSKGRSVDLSINNSLKRGQKYTFTVTNGDATVGTGSFTTSS
ncbi:MAG: hypothetical protein IPL36_08525 [Nigerium sp.]|nr:hypothetical protein [Nigerium sp.]